MSRNETNAVKMPEAPAASAGSVTEAVVSVDSASPGDPVERERLAKLATREAYHRETQRKVEEMEGELKQRKGELADLQRKAAHQAGALGLLYDPKTDWLVRPLVLEPLAASHERRLEESGLTWVAPDGTSYYQPEDPPSEEEAASAAQQNGELRSESSNGRVAGAARDAAGASLVRKLSGVFFHRPEAEPAAGTSADGGQDGYREALGSMLIEEKPYAGKEVPYSEWIGWLVALLAGMFVGYGLGMLSGLLSETRDPRTQGYKILCMIVGAGLVAGMKAAVGTMWFTQGRRNARNQDGGSWWPIVVATLLTVTMIVAEVALGAAAFQTYLSRTTLLASEQAGNQHVPAIVLILVALCVTMPLLVMEAFSKYFSGRASLTMDEKNEAIRAARLEARQRALEQQRQKAEEDRRRKEQEERQRIEREHQEYLERHREARERWEKDRELLMKYETLPDYQAFLKYLGEIHVVREQIRSLEREITKYKISRGYGRP